MSDLRCQQCDHGPEHHPMKDGRECCVLTDCDCGQYVAPMESPLAVAKPERQKLEALLKAVGDVLEHDVHMDRCPETLMGNGAGPCECPAKPLRETFAACTPGLIDQMLDKVKTEAETQTILNLANYKLPEDPVLEAHGVNIIRSGLQQLMDMRNVLLALAPFVAALSRATNVSPSSREELLKIEPKMLEVLLSTKEQAKQYDRLAKPRDQ